jgi:hypothetical protein
VTKHNVRSVRGKIDATPGGWDRVPEGEDRKPILLRAEACIRAASGTFGRADLRVLTMIVVKIRQASTSREPLYVHEVRALDAMYERVIADANERLSSVTDASCKHCGGILADGIRQPDGSEMLACVRCERPHDD